MIRVNPPAHRRPHRPLHRRASVHMGVLAVVLLTAVAALTAGVVVAQNNTANGSADRSADAHDAPPHDPPATEATQSRPFLVFDALMFKERPDMASFGMRRLRMVYAQDLWPNKPTAQLPHENAVRAVARQVHRQGDLVCIDIEHWPLFDQDNELREDNLRKYQQVADWFHAAEPGVRLGYYAVVPPRAYNALAQHYQPGIQQWKARCAAMQPLASHVDVVFPSLYTLSDDPEAWRHFAKTTLQEARQYHKQVYAFLWPSFHEASKRAGEPIPGKFWRLQLDTCRKYADGVVIWGGYQKEWNKNAEWWQETREFLDELRDP